MGVTAKGKWIHVGPPTTPVAAAARRSLQLRMETVCAALPRAARDAQQNTELVHRLRVACRRAAACIDAYEPLIRRGKKKLRKRLGEIRRAAGPARDLDVLLERQAITVETMSHAQRAGVEAAPPPPIDRQHPLCQPLIERLQECRLAAQPSLIEIARQKRMKSLARAVRKCLRSIDDNSNDNAIAHSPFQQFAAHQLQQQAAIYLSDCRSTDHSVAQLHAVRISGKQLRYSIELFQSAVPKPWRKNVYRRVANLQDRLGRINDHAVAQLSFQRLLAEMPPDELAAFTAEIIVAEHQELTAASEEFLAWWTPERREQFASLLLDQPVESSPTGAKEDEVAGN